MEQDSEAPSTADGSSDTPSAEADRPWAHPHPGCAVRPALLSDVEALLALEQSGFQSDRLSGRNFLYMLTKANAETVVAERDGRVVGYALILYSNGRSLARLYSLTTDPTCRREGIGRLLLTAAEAAASHKGCASLRLELRIDNAPAKRLYESAGYRELATIPDYYEDKMAALRFEKTLAPSDQTLASKTIASQNPNVNDEPRFGISTSCSVASHQ